MKKIIIYGAETQEQITLIRTLKRAGLKTLILAKSVSSVGRYSICAHEVLVMPSFPPTEQYLSNLITKRKISHIITTDLRDSIYLQEIKSRNMLGDACVMDPHVDLLKMSQDKDAIKNLFMAINQPFAEYQFIRPQDDVRELMLDITYPVQFIDYNIASHKREVYYASNFVNFHRQADKIFKKNHIVAIIDKKFYGQKLYQDHYLFENQQIKHSWHTASYISPYDKLSLSNNITIMPKNQFPRPEVDQAALDITKKLNISKDIISLSYFKDQKTNQIYFIDLGFGGNLQAMPLLQQGSVKFIEARLKNYDFKYIQDKNKPLKSSYLYFSGKQKFQAFISLNEFYKYHKRNTLAHFKAIPIFPLLDSDDLNPLVCLIWRFIKNTPLDIYYSVSKKIKKLYTDYTIAQNRKKFEQLN